MKLSLVSKSLAFAVVFCTASFGQFWSSGTNGTGRQFICPYYNGAYYSPRVMSPSGWAKAGDTATLQFGDERNTIKNTVHIGFSINPYMAPNAITVQNVTGNVGIGTGGSAPTAKLDVRGSISAGGNPGSGIKWKVWKGKRFMDIWSPNRIKHGLDPSKIISITGTVTSKTTGQIIASTYYADQQYFLGVSNDQIDFYPGPTGSNINTIGPWSVVIMYQD